MVKVTNTLILGLVLLFFGVLPYILNYVPLINFALMWLALPGVILVVANLGYQIFVEKRPLLEIDA